MSIFNANFGIPRHIQSLEEFGVGSFSRDYQAYKCTRILELMQRRKPLHQKPMFSVIVPVHKESRYILGTLRSLAEQKQQSAEFIIVSNGEPKGNPSQRLAEASGFRVIHERKPGVARARQIGLEAAQGRIVVTTDADTLHSRHWLNAIADEWKESPDLMGGFGWMYALSPSLFYQLCIQVQSVSRGIQGQHLVFGAAEANSWFLREAALEIGGYDTERTYAEGASLLQELVAKGEIRASKNIHAAAYTSDRRAIGERLWAGTQYLVNTDPHNIRYEPVR